MAKLNVTLDVDPGVLFDRLHHLKGDTAALGARLAGLLLTGEAGIIDRVGLAVYGIEISNVTKTKGS